MDILWNGFVKYMYRIKQLQSYQIKELAEFMASSNFLWNDFDLLKYIVKILSHKIEDNIIVTYKGKIVGCNLYLRTVATINGEIRTILWSHSTYLSPEHRKCIGLEFFINSYSKDDVWGFGLTEMNRRIHQLSGTTFCGKSCAYIVSPYFIKTKKSRHFCNNSRLNEEYIFPYYYELDGKKYIKCFSARDHNMPEGGFWNPSVLDVDFVRNQEFMEKRFYNNSKKYHIYRTSLDPNCDDSYFVFKVTTIKDLPALYLVDYRFNISDRSGLSAILNSLCYLASDNDINSIYFFTTLPTEYIYSNYGFITPYGNKADIITNSLNVTNDCFMMVTPGDSDCELIPY